ncbi:MAG: hypothetical protein MZV70_45790 [Desulfobacterales bacterium]|nr:hypothetical protein [Desulfobacterales bacterium]
MPFVGQVELAPLALAVAPVKAPFSCPKSSLSMSSSGMAAQFTSTKGLNGRACCVVWMRAGHEFLAGAVLSQDEHPGVGGRRPGRSAP